MRSLLIQLFVFSFIFMHGQNEDSFKKHEIKLNGLSLVTGSAEIGYDYIINDESSFGISGSVAFDDSTDLRNSIFANYRFYFGNKRAAGFFAEAFGGLNTWRSEEFITTGLLAGFYEDEDETNFGLGISIGGKFITKGGLVADIYLGVARNFGASDGFEAIPRIGISLGKRF